MEREWGGSSSERMDSFSVAVNSFRCFRVEVGGCDSGLCCCRFVVSGGMCTAVASIASLVAPD